VKHIAGHEHIAPERKKDPGKGFSWLFLQQGLGLSSKYFPESVIHSITHKQTQSR
jgi:AmpD protein